MGVQWKKNIWWCFRYINYSKAPLLLLMYYLTMLNKAAVHLRWLQNQSCIGNRWQKKGGWRRQWLFRKSHLYIIYIYKDPMFKILFSQWFEIVSPSQDNFFFQTSHWQVAWWISATFHRNLPDPLNHRRFFSIFKSS
jgi:hypothetical protein